jgi:hypothetical protein
MAHHRRAVAIDLNGETQGIERGDLVAAGGGGFLEPGRGIVGGLTGQKGNFHK